LYVLRLNLDQLTIDRDQFIDELKERNVGTSVHYISVHLHPFYAQKYGFAPESLPVTWDTYNRIISLPLNVRITDEEVAYVIDALKDVSAKYTR
jgi:dTDP-4-amino-4,6-dideoxygalactose transaminase